MTEKYHSLDDLIDMIDEPNRSSCKKMYADHKDLFDYAKGSKAKHQAREGGYVDHITEIMNIAVRLYDTLSACRPLPFKLSDSLVVLYLHDLEKPWKYSNNDHKIEELQKYADYKDFISEKIKAYNFQISDELHNALTYIHGEGGDHNPNDRVQLPLAAFVHSCDTVSARVWFDEPKKRNSR